MPIPLLVPLAAMGAQAIANPMVREKAAEAAKSVFISTMKTRLGPKIKGIVEKYKDDACSNPPVFIGRVIDDMKASTFFPSEIRTEVEGHRAQIEAKMQEMLTNPEFQQACEAADLDKITDTILTAVKDASLTSGGKRRRRSSRRRRVSRRRRSRTRRN